MTKNILITGGAGFIGSHLVNRLFKKGGYNITVLDNLIKQIHGEDQNSFTFRSIKGKCKFVEGDVQDEKLFVSKPELVRLSSRISLIASSSSATHMLCNFRLLIRNLYRDLN